MPTPLHILMLEDNPADAELIARELLRSGLRFELHRIATEEDFLAGLDPEPDLIIADYRLPSFDALCALGHLRKRNLDVPCIVVSGAIGDEQAAETIRHGATDYLLKDRLGRLGAAVRRSLDEKRLRDQKRVAEARHRKSAARYREFIEGTSDLITQVDSQGRLLFVNHMARTIFGLPPAECIGRPAFDFVHPDDRERTEASFAQWVKERIANVRFENRQRCLSGEVFHMAWNIHLHFNEDGSVKTINSIARDVTRKKALELALRDSLDSLQALVGASPLAIVQLDPEGRVQLWNRSAERIFGWKAAEVIGQPNPIVPKDKRTEFRHHLDRVRQGSPLENIEVVRRCKDGSPIDVSFSLAAMTTPEEKLIGYMAVLADITQRRQRERELEAIARMAAALRPAHSCSEMYPIILDSLLDLVPIDGACLLTRDPETGEIRIQESRGACAGSGLCLPDDGGSIAEAFATGRSVLGQNGAGTAYFFPPEPDTPLPSVACLPLTAHGQTNCLLCTSSRIPLPENEIRLLEAIADIAASAIHRSSLHEQTQKQVEHLHALRNIDMAIIGNLDSRNTLQVLLEQIVSQLKVDAASILLYRANLGHLEFGAHRGFRIPLISKTRLGVGEGLPGKAALERQTVHVPDLPAAGGQLARADLVSQEGFVCYFGVPLIARGEVQGVLEIFHRSPFTPDPQWMDFLEALGRQAAIAIDNAGLFENLQRTNMELFQAYNNTIEGWSRALDLRDKETVGHSLRVTEETVRLARALGISGDDLVHLRRGALLHDIGKMGVPDRILLKPGKLTDEEWEIMRRHPTYAYELLSPIDYLRPALDIPYCHHEKWDGSGYPRGLKEEQIPLAARIFALIDVWDALTSDRPYRSAWSPEAALDYIRKQSGIHFDPAVVQFFLHRNV